MSNVPLDRWEQFKRDQLKIQESLKRANEKVTMFRMMFQNDLLAAEATAAVGSLLWKLGMRVEGQ